mmetsp:Transcript_30441/g.89689  ORF Transcript_30441/g.89689 Transcript_30441/m.89689 type:complete len:430 (-) Transcript_30441:307-1596(-)
MASVVPIPAVAPEGSFDPDDPLVALPYIGKTFRTVLDLTKGSVRTNLSQLLVQQLTTNVRLLPTDPTDKAFNALVKFVMKYDKLEKHAREIVKKGKVVKHNLSKQAAEALKKKLEALGGKAEIGGGIAIDRKGPINTGYVLKVKGSDVVEPDDFIEELSFQMKNVMGNSAINREDILDPEKWITSAAGDGPATLPSFVLEATLGVRITLKSGVKLVLDSPNFLFPDLTADWNEKPIKISDMRAQFEIDFTKFDTSDPKNSEFTIKFDILEEYNPKVEWDVSLSAFFVNLPVPDIITPALAQNLVMNLLPKVTPVSVTYSEGHFEWTVKPTLKPKTFFKNWGRSVLCCHPELTLHSLCIGLPQICADCCIGCSLDFWRQCFEGEAPCCGACRAGLCCCDGGILACCCKPSKGDEKESGTVTVTSKASDPV